MAKRVQWIGHITSALASFIGLDREITVDTTKRTLVVHDGATAGGIPLAREDAGNIASTNAALWRSALQLSALTPASAHKLNATVAPVAANDSSQGYVVGSMWINTTAGTLYICTNSAAGAAVWYDFTKLAMTAGTTAAPGLPFTADSNTGLGQVGGADTLSVIAGGLEALRIVGSANAVNLLQIGNTATGVRVALQARGTDTNVGVGIDTKGSGDILFSSQAYGSINFQIGGGTVNAVNYLSVSGAAIGNAPNMVASGSDTNIGINWKTKGTGTYNFMCGDGTSQFQITPVAGATRAITVAGSNGGNPKLSATGGAIQFDIASIPKIVNLGNVSGTVTLDLAQGNVFICTLVGNATFAAPTNMANCVGQFFTVLVTQDGTGSRTGGWNTVFNFGSNALTLTTTPGKTDRVTCQTVSSTSIQVVATKGF